MIPNDEYGFGVKPPTSEGFPLKPSTMLLTVASNSGSRSSLPHRCNVAAAVEDMTVAEEIARMDAQLDQLQELSNEVFRRDPNADVPQNIQAIRTDVHQLVEQGTAQQQAAAAKRYGEAFQKTCEATNRFVHACQDGTEKERAMAGIEIVSQVSAAFPPPYGPAMGGLCSLTTLVMDLAWDSPSKSPFEVMLEAIQKMIDEAAEANNHLCFKFQVFFLTVEKKSCPSCPRGCLRAQELHGREVQRTLSTYGSERSGGNQTSVSPDPC